MNETTQALEKGDKITIAGCGTGPNGEEVFANYDIMSGNQCEVVRLRIYTLAEKLSGFAPFYGSAMAEE